MIYSCLARQLGKGNPEFEACLAAKSMCENINKAHVTLAHKRSYGATAVANYSIFLHCEVPVELTALLFAEKMAAFEASIWICRWGTRGLQERMAALHHLDGGRGDSERG